LSAVPGGAADSRDAPAVTPPPTPPPGCFVVVIGPPGQLRRLSRNLPASWNVEFVDEVDELPSADLVVLVRPTPGTVAAVHVRQPEAAVVALAHPSTRAETVVELLQAGATACVRSGEPELVAAHLLACARRHAVPAP
jgi:hypothetical protein